MRKHDKQLHLDLIEELERGKEKKKKDYERGVFIKNSIRNGEIDPDILTEEHHKAMKTKFRALKVEVILKPWQEKLVELIKPSEREIIWIVGSVGNEGKTWFQKYLKDIHGVRVFDANIKKSSKCILHILSKEIVSLKDLFLFNVPRSFNMDDFPYEMLEELKDGKAESTKYNSVKLELNTPNTVLVFSNEKPDKERMSNDRWVIYLIGGGGYLLRTNGYKV